MSRRVTTAASPHPARVRLAALRSAIDGVDGELRALLCSRARHAAEIGQVKRSLGLPVRVRGREAQVRQRLRRGNPGPLPDGDLLAIMDRVMQACRGLQAVESVACLGPRGSYSHHVAEQHFGARVSQCMVSSISEVVRRVAVGAVAAGVVPADNLQIGPIEQTRRALAQHPGVQVCEALVQPVELVLLVRPGTTTIREIHSKPEAFGQCEGRLRSGFGGVRRVPTTSTSAAARHVAQRAPQEGIAALAGPFAAAHHGLAVHTRALTDRPGNATVFWVLEREHSE